MNADFDEDEAENKPSPLEGGGHIMREIDGHPTYRHRMDPLLGRLLHLLRRRACAEELRVVRDDAELSDGVVLGGSTHQRVASRGAGGGERRKPHGRCGGCPRETQSEDHDGGEQVAGV
ncbi:MAG: hypothetical protein SGPRY_000298 [Prymnesium sp.]